MEVRVLPISSGSCGNCFFFQCGDTRFLIDAGVPVSSIHSALKAHQIPLQSLNAVFVTHDHNDHIAYLKDLLKMHPMAVWLSSRLSHLGEWLEEEEIYYFPFQPGQKLTFGDVWVYPLSLPHDAISTVGYIFQYRDVKLSYFTDLGVCLPSMLRAAEGSTLLVIEANHDEEKLVSGPYPEYLKKRIQSSRGHLSNRQCGEALVQILSNGREKMDVMLAHLSAVNNTPEMALSSVETILKKEGKREKVRLTFAPRGKPGNLWRLP